MTIPEAVSLVLLAGTYVKGGEIQTWDANGGGTYTYNLFETAANTRYYLYAYAKAGIDTIKLGYYQPKQ